MDWTFELLAGPYGGTTEGPAWDGQTLLFTHIPGNRIMRYDPHTGTCTEFRTGTHSTNGLMFDAQGRLYGCQSGQHCITRFEPDGNMAPLPNRLDGRRQLLVAARAGRRVPRPARRPRTRHPRP